MIINKNPYLLFSPFLLFYVLFVLFLHSNIISGDEHRYIFYAHNLLNGFYSPPAPDIVLTSGPGYPIILMPFIALHLPKICMALMNAVFHYLTIIFLFKTLQQFVSYKKTLIFSLFWACYYVAYQKIFLVNTEIFTMFLISLFIFYLVKAFNKTGFKETKKYIFLSGIILGFIVLTKVIFGLVVSLMILGSGLLLIIKRNVINYRKGVIILIIAFATFLPYLIYTYHITDRVFYWGTGSDNLYWMSTPYAGEYGDWKGPLTLNPLEYGNYNIPGADDTLIAHHQKDYDEIYKLKGGLEQDDAFKKIAINNIKSHPFKYAQNIFFNIGRIVFHYPFSYAVQRPKPLFVMPINGIIFTLIIICLFPTLINWRKIIFPIRFMLFLAFLYLGGSALLSAETRMFTIIVPILLFWIAYIAQKSMVFKLKFDEKNEEE
jgi:4-amino-4-deoxy-L-arabinose transferase-like glycosyltransferase